MTKLLTPLFLIFSLYGKGQSRYPGDKYANGLSSQGNLWFYVEHVDRAVDSLTAQITHLQHQVDSLIEAMRPNGVIHFDGITPDATHAGELIYTDNGIPVQEASRTLYNPGRNKGRIMLTDSVTAYLIDTRANTIAIDHRTKLPHVRPDHPSEGMLVEPRPKHYEYFANGRWIPLKEVK